MSPGTIGKIVMGTIWKSYDSKNGIYYYVNTKKDIYFFTDSIVYPFINVEEKGSTKDRKKFFL